MKRQGETEANPRFKQLSSQLLAIQKAQSLRSAQQQQQQQHQQHQQLPNQPQPQQQQPAQQPARQVDAQPTQAGPSGMQGSPVIPQRPQDNGQLNGIFYRDV